jgi:hypothetical protein
MLDLTWTRIARQPTRNQPVDDSFTPGSPFFMSLSRKLNMEKDLKSRRGVQGNIIAGLAIEQNRNL